MPLRPGTKLGPYKSSPLLAREGCARCSARDSNLDRNVAVKVLLDFYAPGPERVACFQREARALASLDHPDIASV